jgi:hypothetical protein
MITRKNQPPRRRQAGVAAVEFAILLPLMFVLLSAPLFIGRVMWHYTVAQKAAHDAVRYLATVSEAEMRTPALITSAVAAARAIASAELAELNPGPYPPSVIILCDAAGCDGFTMPTTVRVTVRMEMHDPFFPTEFGGDYGLFIAGDAQMSYLGTK